MKYFRKNFRRSSPEEKLSIIESFSYGPISKAIRHVHTLGFISVYHEI